MKKIAALMAVVAVAGLMAACQPGKPVEASAYESRMVMSAEKTDPAPAPMYSGKSGRTFEAQ